MSVSARALLPPLPLLATFPRKNPNKRPQAPAVKENP